MRVLLAFVLAVNSLPLTRSSAAAQAAAAPGPTATIERLVAQYARRHTPKGRVVLDPWTRTPWSPNTRVELAQRDSGSLADLAAAVGASAGQGLLFICDVQGRKCRMADDGVDGVITISRPIVTGDRAEVIVTITTRSMVPYRALHEYEETVAVVKDGAQWRVVGPTKWRAS